ncbi:MAG: thermonuclease family protein [Alphaproteobacteria bacterium]|nr:thermonuclease family protein [Alphaproteobacteria bacterium]
MDTVNPTRPRNVACAIAGLIAVLVVFHAAGALAELKQEGAGIVKSVVDGDTLILTDGREIRLVGIQAPKLPLGRRGFKAWPLAGEAKQALEKLTLGKRLTLSFGGRRMDRHGRWLAHLHTKSRLWVQGALLKEGMARVYSFADNRAVIAEMLALERESRAAKRGIWGNDFYQVLKAEKIDRRRRGFQIVEGRVLKVAPTRRRTYLNFGRDWKRDFTIVIEARSRRAFPERGARLKKLEGKRVRVRGWLRWRNGPMLTATHPEQIEVLGK